MFFIWSPPFDCAAFYYWIAAVHSAGDKVIVQPAPFAVRRPANVRSARAIRKTALTCLLRLRRCFAH